MHVIKKQRVTAAHRQLQPQRSCQCVVNLLGKNRMSNGVGAGRWKGKCDDGWGSGVMDEVAGHQNSHSSDEMQQRKLLFHVVSQRYESVVVHRPSRLIFVQWPS
ncbi:hypothetical protein EVAR_63037_1 [Eumeta japonica]|uniref:Uncharacterized protein n=1 Tax=Eumeta variegata TaxID=151549 RepID=A0A4C1YYF6_EUMVA|nr:hypothetical protein EVAR_63037_1 [Eumeta japonica]